jgi:hypothetical protein
MSIVYEGLSILQRVPHSMSIVYEVATGSQTNAAVSEYQ